jgi:hypothetical protein
LSIPKLLLITACVLFAGIGVIAVAKKGKNHSDTERMAAQEKIEEKSSSQAPRTPIVSVPVQQSNTALPKHSLDDFPNIDRIFQLFTTGPTKLPIVETIEYSSSVSWLKGRPAWIADYAVYYNTSRHFIARSLNGRADYFAQKIISGSRFNVFKRDKKIEFHLLLDVSRAKMGFYYVDLDTKERVLLKTYRVGLGRLDSQKASGTLTPLGTYSLGDRIAVYRPGVTGLFQDQKTEMIRVFGTRWIPFDQEIEHCSEPAKGYGIQGAPWIVDAQTGQLVENRECIGKYESDGCIRLTLEDIEELFSIVITKPTYIHIVKDFHEAKLPGTEVGIPSR